MILIKQFVDIRNQDNINIFTSATRGYSFTFTTLRVSEDLHQFITSCCGILKLVQVKTFRFLGLLHLITEKVCQHVHGL